MMYYSCCAGVSLLWCTILVVQGLVYYDVLLLWCRGWSIMMSSRAGVSLL